MKNFKLPNFNDYLIESKQESEISYKCPFDKNFFVIIVYKESPHFDMVESLVPGSFAFTVVGKPIIIVNGEILKEEDTTQEQLDFILAHELAHQYLNHKGTLRDPGTEADADYGAYLILLKHKNKAAKKVKKWWGPRNGSTLARYEKSKGIYIKNKLKQDGRI